ncbi:MAG TPA: 3-oxoadipate enol-lactonase [Stellaceae bacterium]|nr:3-oxoadipate enol-lactonase [Stellaceae bacterium]
MPFVRAGDITVHYVLEGPENAPVVMLSNSLGTSLALWDAQAAVLRGKYRVLRYDTRGHGLTDAPDVGEAGYTMDLLADDAAALMKALGLRRVHLCGLSIGGMLGQKLAAKAPELLASLILVDTASQMSQSVWDERIAAIRKSGGIAVTVDGTMERWFTKPFREREPATIAGIRNMYLRTPMAGYLGCALAIRNMDLRPDDARIVCPTLIIVGEEDPATPVASARTLNTAIKGSKLTIIPQAAHIVAIEQPAAVTRALGDFLAAQ